MRFMLDTNSCVYLFTGSSLKLAENVANCSPDDLAISSIVLAELAVGVKRGLGPSAETLEAFIGEVPVLPFETGAALAFAHLPFKRGRFDDLIAAHALSLDLTLVTADERDFQHVPGLKMVNWTV